MRQEFGLGTRSLRRGVAGARLATTAVLAGALATAASLSAVAYVAAVGSSAAPQPARGARLASHSPVRPAAESKEGAPDGSGRAMQGASREHPIGNLVMVDVNADVPSLDDELDHQRALARQEGQRVLLWVVVADCKPCAATEAALPAEEVQRALARTRLVRLNAVDFLAELSRLGIPMDAFPAFVLLGPDGRATDYVDGGEWDEDIPENIAPVLKSFIEGTYVRRRAPWHGGLHEDETPI